MTASGAPNRQMRYRAYFWLMNASFGAIVFSLAELLAGRLTGYDTEDHLHPLVITILYTTFAIFMFLVPMFLVCARFLRDEYAEGLWRRTSVVLTYATAALPLAFFILSWGWYFATGHTDAKQVHWSLRWLADDIGWGEALMIVWLGYMMVFVVLFQFLRWRDLR